MKYSNYISNIFKHFKKICIHKYWVFYYCCKAGIPLQGLVHDLSKFSTTEFWESVKYYQGTSSPIDACKKANGWSAAWMHHKGRNKHHYEYWQDNFDNGGNPIEMPMKYKKKCYVIILVLAERIMENLLILQKSCSGGNQRRVNRLLCTQMIWHSLIDT